MQRFLVATKWWHVTVVLSLESRWSSSNSLHRHFFTGAKARIWKTAGHYVEFLWVFLRCRLQKESSLQTFS